MRISRRSLVLFGFGFIIIMTFNCFTGIVMYARYHDCDPLSLGHVNKLDKMVPYFVEDIMGHLSGMPGVFISCVFSAALSTLSANINSLSGIVYFDYIKPHIQHTEHKANLMMKLFVFFAGIYCIIGGIAVEKFSSILQIVYSIGGVSFGSVAGVFLLGMLVPRAHGRVSILIESATDFPLLSPLHSQAAFCGAITSIACMIYIVVGSWGRNQYETLMASTDNCPGLNVTTTTVASVLLQANETTAIKLDDGFNILDLSFNWYTFVGFLITWFVGIALSYLLSPAEDANFDPKLLSPIIQSFVHYELTSGEELSELTIKKKKENIAET